MSLAIVTSGYLNASLLVIALLIAIKRPPKQLVRADKGINPTIALNVEKLLAIALAVGIFICGMLVFSSLFPPVIKPVLKGAADGLTNYMGL